MSYPAEMPSDDLIALLRCPTSGQTLRIAPPEILAKVSLPAALVREDGRVVYPIVDGIPLLLVDEAIRVL